MIHGEAIWMDRALALCAAPRTRSLRKSGEDWPAPRAELVTVQEDYLINVEGDNIILGLAADNPIKRDAT
jgi:hypothetical protein